MPNLTTQTTQTLQSINAVQKFNMPEIKARFAKVLGQKAEQFIVSLQSVLNSTTLRECQDFDSVFGAAMTAAALDLPINSNLGFAYIVPYVKKVYSEEDKKWVNLPAVAQLQIGYKGFIQLAQRSGLFKTINVSMVKQGELISYDRKTGYLEFDWKTMGREKLSDIGCVAYFELLNGFEKSLFMTKEELLVHGGKYSQSYKTDKSKNSNSSLWSTNFEAMAQKTCIKLLLSKYAPLSTSMQTAVDRDQAVIKGEQEEIEYVDNEPKNVVEAPSSTSPIITFIQNAKTIEVLREVQNRISSAEEQDCYNNKLEELATNKEK